MKIDKTLRELVDSILTPIEQLIKQLQEISILIKELKYILTSKDFK